MTAPALEQLPVCRTGRFAVARPWLLARTVVMTIRPRLEDPERAARVPLDRADAERHPFRRILEPVGLDIASSMRFAEVLWLDPHPLALEQPEDSGLAGFRALVLAVRAGSLVVRLVGRRLLVGRDVALVVAEHDLVVGVAD